MRPILTVIFATIISGCASTEWLAVDQCSYGYRPEDPKIRCGEKWDVVHRHPFDAQIRRARGEQW
jgi:hypothetical protein